MESKLFSDCKGCFTNHVVIVGTHFKCFIQRCEELGVKNSVEDCPCLYCLVKSTCLIRCKKMTSHMKLIKPDSAKFSIQEIGKVTYKVHSVEMARRGVSPDEVSQLAKEGGSI